MLQGQVLTHFFELLITECLLPRSAPNLVSVGDTPTNKLLLVFLLCIRLLSVQLSGPQTMTQRWVEEKQCFLPFKFFWGSAFRWIRQIRKTKKHTNTTTYSQTTWVSKGFDVPVVNSESLQHETLNFCETWAFFLGKWLKNVFFPSYSPVLQDGSPGAIR